MSWHEFRTLKRVKKIWLTSMWLHVFDDLFVVFLCFVAVLLDRHGAWRVRFVGILQARANESVATWEIFRGRLYESSRAVNKGWRFTARTKSAVKKELFLYTKSVSWSFLCSKTNTAANEIWFKRISQKMVWMVQKNEYISEFVNRIDFGTICPSRLAYDISWNKLVMSVYAL